MEKMIVLINTKAEFIEKEMKKERKTVWRGTKLKLYQRG